MSENRFVNGFGHTKCNPRMHWSTMISDAAPHGPVATPARRHGTGQRIPLSLLCGGPSAETERQIFADGIVSARICTQSHICVTDYAKRDTVQ